MNEYNLDSKYRFYSKTVTKGTQEKYKKDDFYYKVNKLGNEGFTEYLVSRLLKNSTLPDYAFVDYEYCRINNKLGCRSKNFLSTPNEEFITINSLYCKITGKDNLSDYLAFLSDANDRLNYILSIIEYFGFNKRMYYDYLNILLQLDLLIRNNDRHVHNYGLIYNSAINRFRLAPIFDNGLSLNTDNSGNTTSCTISGSFLDQVTTFGFPIKPSFRLDYSKISKDLKRIESLYGKHKEIDFLRNNLEEYRNIFSL